VILAGEPGEAGARIARGQPRGAAAQQAAGQDAIGGHADAELAHGGQDLPLDAPAHQRVLDLQRGDGVDGVGPPDGLRPHLGQADVTDVPGPDHLRDRPDRVLDGHPRVEPGGLVQVHVVGAEPGQRVGQRVLYRGRAGVVPDERAGRVPLPAELHLDEYAVPADPAQRAPQQQLVVAHAVEVTGVEQRDPRVESGADGGDALVVVGLAVDARHAHQAKPGAGHHRPAAAQRGRLHHACTLPGGWRPAPGLRRTVPGGWRPPWGLSDFRAFGVTRRPSSQVRGNLPVTADGSSTVRWTLSRLWACYPCAQ